MPNLVSYRKYRPKTFAEVVNQEHIKTTLANAVSTARIAHAYLFVGPRGVGKTTLARIFARAINCTNRQGSEPCNECDICRSFFDGTNLDLLEIDAASHTGVDHVRELIDHLQFAPTQAKYKVIIVDEVHMLSKPAFNALLKTLEEPPSHAVFILATTELQKVPPTIISRTQHFEFKKVSIADLTKLLTHVCEDSQVQITESALFLIATAADGSFRDALSLLDQVISYSAGRITEDLAEEVLGLVGTKTTSSFLDLILNLDMRGALDFIGHLSYQGRDLYQFEKDFLEYLRKLLLVKIGVTAEFGFSSEIQEKISRQAESTGRARITSIIQIFQAAEEQMKWAVIQSLPLELAAVEATSIPDEPKVVAMNSTVPEDVSSTTVLPAKPQGPDPAPTATLDPGILDMVISRWPQIMEKVKEYNHSLIPSLKLAEPKAVEGGELILLFPYKFHKDAIDARKNRIVLDQVIEEICGMRLLVKPMVAKDWGSGVVSVEPKSTLLNSALKIMGGEVE